MKLRINVCKYEELYEGELDKAPKEISNMQVVYIGTSDACLITIKVNLVFIKDRNKKIYNSTLNDRLERVCKKAGIQVITMHGLRHTHASILLYSGVSIASVAKRLGHSNMSTTQKVYLHVISELENKDNNKVMSAMCEF